MFSWPRRNSNSKNQQKPETVPKNAKTTYIETIYIAIQRILPSRTEASNETTIREKK